MYKCEEFDCQGDEEDLDEDQAYLRFCDYYQCENCMLILCPQCKVRHKDPSTKLCTLIA